MKISSRLIFACAAVGLAIATGGAAIGQGMQGGMGQGMMGSGMMRGGMGQGMMCPMMAGMMQGNQNMSPGTTQGGMGAVFGTRVTPVMNLSVDDVRTYLTEQLERVNNKRLKLGNINADGATITADAVTVDNSLVQRLKINRHSGAIAYES
jgi:hypothetical protein